jgi:type I site-specific restriction endonuclease
MKLRFKNKPSKYETLYIEWEGVQYDRKILKKFIRRFRWVKFLSKFMSKYKNELHHMIQIVDHYGRIKIFNLMGNDEEVSRLSHIERLSRKGSIEILTSGTYKSETYKQISNLPKRDFDLITKRIQELIKIGQSVYVQNDGLGENLPGD